MYLRKACDHPRMNTGIRTSSPGVITINIYLFIYFFFFISYVVGVWHSCLWTNMISCATQFSLGPHRTDAAICMDTQDVQPNNSYYMNSIAHVYGAAWLLRGALKQTLIAQFVRPANDQQWWHLSCNSLSISTSMPEQTVILILTLYMGVEEMLHQSRARINNFLLTFLQSQQLCDVTTVFVEP